MWTTDSRVAATLAPGWHTLQVRRRAARAAFLAGLITLVLVLLTAPAGPAPRDDRAADPGSRRTPNNSPSDDPTDTMTSSPDPDPSETSSPDGDGCQPEPALIDSEATEEAKCLAEKLDRWQSDGKFGVGQQLNVSSQLYLDPLTGLGNRSVAVIGFDLDELGQGENSDFAQPPVQALLAMAEQGKVLTASWHTRNPSNGNSSFDRNWQDLYALLDDSRPEAQRFWRDYARTLELFKRFQTGDGGAFEPAAVIFRPLHEANGDWLWWAQGSDPNAYKQVYAKMQERAAAAGVHNIVWGWSPNAKTHDGIEDPMIRMPDRVDLAGVDSYDEVATHEQADQLSLAGLSEMTSRTSRVAVTEFGPHGSKAGDWDPSVIGPSAVAQGVRPAYVMLWFDDSDGRKQLSSLQNGPTWLDSCVDGLCSLS